MAFLVHTHQPARLLNAVCALGAALLFAGCGDDRINVYQVTKEAPEHDHSQEQGGSRRETAASAPTLEWVTPKDWEQVSPGQMRFASFRVKGPDGKTADLGIFPLPGMGMGDLDNVNRWRGQVGLPPITEDERAKAALNVEVDGQSAQVYEMSGETAGSGERTRILGAILKREAIPWYFKMTGDDQLVAEQKDAFIGFLKSLKFGTAGETGLPPSHPPIGGESGLPPSHPPIGGATTPSKPVADSGNKPKWEVPGGWQEIPGGQFLVAKFNIAGPENTQASVNVSSSSGDGGGLVSNVNRWRRQIGLEESSADQVMKLASELAGQDGKATVVDMTGKGATTGKPERVIGAVIPIGSQTWFYKLSGSETLVAREKENFMKFVQTAKHPNA